MRLVITADYVVSSDLDVTYISAEMLLSPATHLFLASNTWDSVQVEVCKSLPVDMVQYIAPLSKDIQVQLPDVVDDHTFKVLLELFPSKAGAIRRAYMCGSPMDKVVSVCRVK